MFALALVLVALAGAFFGRFASGYVQAKLRDASAAYRKSAAALKLDYVKLHAEFSDGRRNALYLAAAVVLFLAGVYVGHR